MNFIFELVIALSILALSSAYSNGSIPSTACYNQMPQHPGQPQLLPSPYRVFAESNVFMRNADLFVELSASAETARFKGFYCQARDQSNHIVGHFKYTDDDDYTLVHKCPTNASDSNTVSHNSNWSNGTENETFLTWTTKVKINSSIRFSCTFVQSRDAFWQGVESTMLSDIATVTASECCVREGIDESCRDLCRPFSKPPPTGSLKILAELLESVVSNELNCSITDAWKALRCSYWSKQEVQESRRLNALTDCCQVHAVAEDCIYLCNSSVIASFGYFDLNDTAECLQHNNNIRRCLIYPEWRMKTVESSSATTTSSGAPKSTSATTTSGLSAGAIAGIVVVILVLLIAIILLVLCRKRPYVRMVLAFVSCKTCSKKNKRNRKFSKKSITSSSGYNYPDYEKQVGNEPIYMDIVDDPPPKLPNRQTLPSNTELYDEAHGKYDELVILPEDYSGYLKPTAPSAADLNCQADHTISASKNPQLYDKEKNKSEYDVAYTCGSEGKISVEKPLDPNVVKVKEDENSEYDTAWGKTNDYIDLTDEGQALPNTKFNSKTSDNIDVVSQEVMGKNDSTPTKIEESSRSNEYEPAKEVDADYDAAMSPAIGKDGSYIDLVSEMAVNKQPSTTSVNVHATGKDPDYTPAIEIADGYDTTF